MAVDVATLRTSHATHAGIGARLRTVPASIQLASLIAMSAAARFAAALPHSTPRYFPDEYIYSALARSIAHGHLTVRGTPAHFPALLEPLLAAPLTLVGGVETTYRLTQGMHSIVMSLVAIPIYLLARRLSLPHWQGLACAVLALMVPEFVYTSYITADAVALPLALGAVYAGVLALELPTRGRQVAFLALATLATFDRVQYVVLPTAFLVAALVVSDGRVALTVSRYRLTIAVVVVPILAALALGSSRALGYYRGVVHLEVATQTVIHWIGVDAMMFMFACGVVTVPAALVGLGFGLARPLDAFERSFCAFIVALAPLLLIELGLYAASGTFRFQGRYLEALPPLVPVLFCLGMRRMTVRSHRIGVLGLAAGALLLAARIPLSGFVVGDSKQDSPFLQAVWRAEEQLGVSRGALAVSVIASVLAVLAALAAIRPRQGTAVVLAVAFVVLAGLSAEAVTYDIQTTRAALRTFFPTDRRWVDDAHVGPVAVLVTPSSARASISGTLFWNTSVLRLLQMRGAQQVDAFGAGAVHVRRDGTLLVNGSPYRGNLLVEEYADSAQVAGAALVSRTLSASLWRSTSSPRLVSLTDGRYLDGWFGWQSTITVWPGLARTREGAVCMTLKMPESVTATVDITAPGIRRTVVMPAASTRRVALPLRTAVPWTARLKARRPIFLADNRLVSAQGSRPRFVAGKASAATCR